MNRYQNKIIHILHVVPGLLPGGMELTMARVISGLTCPTMRHSIAALKDQPEIAPFLPKQTQIFCLHARPNEPQLPFRLAGLLRRIRPDVIHARNWGAWPDITLARMLVRPMIPLILSFHGLGQANFMPLRRRWASYFLARTADLLFTVSADSKKLLVSRWGWPEGKVGVIPNGLDTDVFRPAERPAINQRMVVGTVGNLRAVKNHALLIRAGAEIVRQGSDMELRIAGEGQERKKLLDLARSLGFDNRLQLPGYVDDVPGFLRGLDIFVLPSDSEQHPNALAEAMACGIASIATDVGAVSEMLDHGKCGRIIPAGHLEELITSLRDIMAQPNLRREYAHAARQRICSRYSLQKMLTNYENMYCALAGKKGSAR